MNLKEHKKHIWKKASLREKMQLLFWGIFWKIWGIPEEIKIIRAIKKAEKLEAK